MPFPSFQPDVLRATFLSTLPLRDAAGEVAGIVGVMRPCEWAGHAPGEYRVSCRPWSWPGSSMAKPSGICFTPAAAPG